MFNGSLNPRSGVARRCGSGKREKLKVESCNVENRGKDILHNGVQIVQNVDRYMLKITLFSRCDGAREKFKANLRWSTRSTRRIEHQRIIADAAAVIR